VLETAQRPVASVDFTASRAGRVKPLNLLYVIIKALPYLKVISGLREVIIISTCVFTGPRAIYGCEIPDYHWNPVAIGCFTGQLSLDFRVLGV
jgi:hypothetical protein